MRMTSTPRLVSLKVDAPNGGHTFSYADWGDPGAKRIVICCHGLTRNGRDFDILARRLVDSLEVRVICPDVVGRGRSDWLDEPEQYGYPQYLSDMTALIATLGAKQVDSIGTSMGGLIGMFLAASPNSQIRALVMNDVGPVLPRAAMARIADYVGADPRFDSLGELEAHLRQIHAPFGPLTDAQWAHLAEHGNRRRGDGSYGLAYDPAIGVNVRKGVQDWDLREIWDKVRCPTLVLRGALSDLLSAETASEMTRRGPNATLATFQGIGHAPALMAEDQLDTVCTWLARQG
jgi:pimeloyl-ACP methyl ester carboxylesterase